MVANPGGTNEAFVRANVHTATLIWHPDNTTIFHEIVNVAADVMITDRVEVTLQTARHPELCATMTGTLSYQEKGYLLPRDPAFKAVVDTWLAMRKADGTVGGLFDRYLGKPLGKPLGKQ